uniref:Uncharacterized protein n=1 Tax=Glossina pallidipes TaxID=7398 RepID=A0A1B0AFI6_GLOPL
MNHPYDKPCKDLTLYDGKGKLCQVRFVYVNVAQFYDRENNEHAYTLKQFDNQDFPLLFDVLFAIRIVKLIAIFTQNYICDVAATDALQYCKTSESIKNSHNQELNLKE